MPAPKKAMPEYRLTHIRRQFKKYQTGEGEYQWVRMVNFAGKPITTELDILVQRGLLEKRRDGQCRYLSRPGRPKKNSGSPLKLKPKEKTMANKKAEPKTNNPGPTAPSIGTEIDGVIVVTPAEHFQLWQSEDFRKHVIYSCEWNPKSQDDPEQKHFYYKGRFYVLFTELPPVDFVMAVHEALRKEKTDEKESGEEVAGPVASHGEKARDV